MSRAFSPANTASNPAFDTAVRSFCRCCGTPLTYERAHSPHMVNIPRALFHSRTGRQPLYHVGIEELQDWTYTGEPLVPLSDVTFAEEAGRASRDGGNGHELPAALQIAPSRKRAAAAAKSR